MQPPGLLERVKLWRYIHLCEFREKVRQYCINKFVRTTLLSENIILFENNTYILVKKKRAKNSTQKQWFCKTPYIYYFKKLGEERNASSSTLYNKKFILVKNFGRCTLRFRLVEKQSATVRTHTCALSWTSPFNHCITTHMRSRAENGEETR